jgi:hypothetical protein
MPYPRWTVPGFLIIIALADSCFWATPVFPGFSLALFFAGTALIIRLNRPGSGVGRLATVMLVLLAATILEAVIETGFCNVLMLAGLTGAFAARPISSGAFRDSTAGRPGRGPACSPRSGWRTWRWPS